MSRCESRLYLPHERLDCELESNHSGLHSAVYGEWHKEHYGESGGMNWSDKLAELYCRMFRELVGAQTIQGKNLSGTIESDL